MLWSSVIFHRWIAAQVVVHVVMRLIYPCSATMMVFGRLHNRTIVSARRLIEDFHDFTISTIQHNGSTVYVHGMLETLKGRLSVNNTGGDVIIESLDADLVGQYDLLFVSNNDNRKSVKSSVALVAIQDISMIGLNNIYLDQFEEQSNKTATCTASMIASDDQVRQLQHNIVFRWHWDCETVFMTTTTTSTTRECSKQYVVHTRTTLSEQPYNPYTLPPVDSPRHLNFSSRSNHSFTTNDTNSSMVCVLVDLSTNGTIARFSQPIVIQYGPRLITGSNQSVAMKNLTSFPIPLHCNLTAFPTATYDWYDDIGVGNRSQNIVNVLGNGQTLVFQRDLTGIYNVTCRATANGRTAEQHFQIHLLTTIDLLFSNDRGFFSRRFSLITCSLSIGSILAVVLIVVFVIFVKRCHRRRQSGKKIRNSMPAYKFSERLNCFGKAHNRYYSEHKRRHSSLRKCLQNCHSDGALDSEGEVQFIDPIIPAVSMATDRVIMNRHCYRQMAMTPTTLLDTNIDIVDSDHRPSPLIPNITKQLTANNNNNNAATSLQSPPPYSAAISRQSAATRLGLISTRAGDLKNQPVGSRMPLRLPSMIRNNNQSGTFIERKPVQV